MQKGDVIITFNYDRILEHLHAWLGDSSPLHVCRPGDGCTGQRPDVVRILKLHGSVDWIVKNGQWSQADERYALHGSEHTLGIAAPGPAKIRKAEQLKELWTAAETSLIDARSVVFVGYRFPPTDSEARRRLLTAIRSNNNSNIPVHVALGPNSVDAGRLNQLLKFSTHTHYGRVQVHELYAEDFFTVATRDRLTRTS